MYVDNELVEFMSAGEQEYEEIVEEYEKILVHEGAPEPSVADFVGTPPAQGKPRCIIPIFEWSWNIYMWYAFMLQAFYGNYMHKYIYLWVLLVQVE